MNLTVSLWDQRCWLHQYTGEATRETKGIIKENDSSYLHLRHVVINETQQLLLEKVQHSFSPIYGGGNMPGEEELKFLLL